jgi:hypothetical protein
MTEPIGRHLPRAKPIHLTFYDRLIDWPYSTTFYVREDTSEEDCHRLIEAVRAVSACELGEYKIGYQKYVVPDYREKLKSRTPGAVMGTFKWLITFHTENGRLHKTTIPGRNDELSINGVRAKRARETGGHYQPIRDAGKDPDREHPLWQQFLKVFTELCVTQEGESISGHVELGRTGSDWPPKGWKKTHR